MNFAYIDKPEFEADIITDILNSENIYFKTKEKNRYIPLLMGVIGLKSFDIKFNTSYQKYIFVDKLIKNKLSQYEKLEKCYDLPSHNKYKIIEPKTSLDIAIDELNKVSQDLENNLNRILKEQPKQTLLYKFAKWLERKIHGTTR